MWGAWGDKPAGVPVGQVVHGGNPAMRPDQRAQQRRSAPGTGPAPPGGIIIARLVYIVGSKDGIFVYAGQPANGNLIISIASAAGTDQFGNAYPAGLSVTQGVISGAVFSGSSLALNPGPLLLYGNPATVQVLLAGAGPWPVPPGLNSVDLVECWGPGGGGGQNGNAGDGGAGAGEYASEANVAVTGGGTAAFTIGAGGASGADGSSATSFTGNAVTVTANAGKHGGNSGNQAGGGGGTGSTNATHHNGGSGGVGFTQLPSGGGGGGSSAGPASGGNRGQDGSSPGGGAGGAAVSGGGAGGAGGANLANGVAGSAPGGGGGGGGGGVKAGGAGAAGQIRLTYTPSGVSALLGSLASFAGADSQGNAYPAGLALGAQMPAQFQTGATPAAPSSGAILDRKS